jgi:hypothetical protein
LARGRFVLRNERGSAMTSPQFRNTLVRIGRGGRLSLALPSARAGPRDRLCSREQWHRHAHPAAVPPPPSRSSIGPL